MRSRERKKTQALFQINDSLDEPDSDRDVIAPATSQGVNEIRVAAVCTPDTIASLIVILVAFEQRLQDLDRLPDNRQCDQIRLYVEMLEALIMTIEHRNPTHWSCANSIGNRPIGDNNNNNN